MENTSTPFFYKQQIRSIIKQVMYAFSWLQVESGQGADGERKMINVPVSYGDKDRVAAAIIASNTHNKAIRLPNAAVYLTDIELAPESLKGYGHELAQRQLPVGGVFPDDARTRVQSIPTPYKFNFEITFMTSNADQRFQIIEQIMLLFQNTYSIDLFMNDRIDSPAKLIQMSLDAFSYEGQYPAGAERRVITQSIRVRCLAYITSPVHIRNDIIKTIKLRLATLDNIDISPLEVVEDIEEFVVDPETIVEAT